MISWYQVHRTIYKRAFAGRCVLVIAEQCLHVFLCLSVTLFLLFACLDTGESKMPPHVRFKIRRSVCSCHFVTWLFLALAAAATFTLPLDVYRREGRW